MELFTVFSIILATSVSLTVGISVCPSEGFAQLPHPNCSLFISCSHGLPREIECPSSLYYNPELQYCDYQGNVVDCIGGTRAPVSGSTPATTQRPTSVKPSSTKPTVNPSSTTTAPENILTKCGQTVTTISGSIDYKLGENLEAGELCAFVIRSPNCSKIRLQIESAGLTESDQITVLYYHQNVNGIRLLTSLGPSSSLVDVPSSLALIVLRTQSSRGTGFRLNFQAVDEASCLPGINAAYNGESASPLQLPFRSNYTDQREIDIVVLTSGAKEITEQGASLQLTVSAPNPIDLCNDRVIIWKLDGDDIVGYVPCGAGDQVYTTKGLYILSSVLNENTSPDIVGTLSWERITEEQ